MVVGVASRETNITHTYLAARADIVPIHRQATRDRKTESIHASDQASGRMAGERTVIKCAIAKPTPPPLHRSNSAHSCTMLRAAREANNMPKGICGSFLREKYALILTPAPYEKRKAQVYKSSMQAGGSAATWSVGT